MTSTMSRLCGFFMFLAIVLTATLLSQVGAINQPGQYSYEIPEAGVQFDRAQRAKEEAGDYQTREILSYLSHLMKSPSHSREPYWLKRGLDLGLGRGFSGSQAAKHLMGKAVADFAYGPGRKRRYVPSSVSSQLKGEDSQAS